MMFNRYKIFAAYIFAIPLALILGVLATSPDELTFMLIGMLLFFLALPLFIKWHHAMLIIFWNSAFTAFFLPGQPDFWLVFAALSFGISVLNRIMGRRPFLATPEMTRPLFFLAAVVLCTAFYRGGIGLKVLGGGAHGGKNYLLILGAIMGYYAFTGGQIPMLKSRRMIGLYFLSGTTFALGNLAYTLGPAFYFVYYLVPSSVAAPQAASDYGFTNINRIEGLAQTCIFLSCFLLAFYGLRGLFNLARPWRLVLLCVTVGASFFAGFRSVIILLFLIFVFQFYFEGLLRTRLVAVLAALSIVGLVVVVLFANRMPLVVQRAMSFLPINVDAGVMDDAKASTEWRLQMWAAVWKDVPKYLLVGKGYSFDAGEMELTSEGIQRGLIASYEESMLAGNYHSGALSVLIPFGVMGTVAFLWVLFAGGRVLYWNYRYGDARLRLINSVLLSYYLAYCVSFFATFGALSYQMYIFLGAVGMSVSLNGGVKTKPKNFSEGPRVPLSRTFAIETS